MRLLIFSGTSEGHALCRFLSARGAHADVYVATEYGRAVMEPLPGMTVHTGRLSAEQLSGEIGSGALVVDATHPYAREVSENLRAACRDSAYLRLLRPCIEEAGVTRVPDAGAAAEWLNRNASRALLATGSKELHVFTSVSGYRKRLFPRVLPSAEAIAACTALGFPASHIIAMQGPFSKELNTALLKQIQADVLVTKDTGMAGGFAEKVAAAREASATVLVISRPVEESGQTLDEVQRLLAERLGLWEPPEIPPRFPLFLPLAGCCVLVVGAGAVAARRVRVLRRFGARVRVVAPENRAGLENVILRGFLPSDLDGAVLAVAAADDRAVNRQAAALCAARGIPVSVADRAEESTFYFPAICEGDGLVAGLISTDGNHRKVRETAAQIRNLLTGGAK